MVLAFLFYCVVSGILSASCLAWEPTTADLEEAFLLWATPRSEYAGRPQEEACALMQADSPAAMMVVPKFLPSPSGSLRDKILVISENFGAGVTGPAFRPQAGEDSPYLNMALFCLAKAKDTEGLPIFLRHLKSVRASTRSVAAMSLGYLGEHRAADALVAALLAETVPMARKSIAFAIGQCSDSTNVTTASLDALIDALADPFFAVHFNAARSLAQLADPALARISHRYAEMSDTGKYSAIHAVGRMYSLPAAAAFLERICRDVSSPDILRGVALKGLLDRKIVFADTDLVDLRDRPVGRGLFGLMR